MKNIFHTLLALLLAWQVQAQAGRVEIEGENFTFCRPTPKLAEKTNPLLFGGRQLALRGLEPFQIRYEFTAPVASEYTIIVKEYYRNGALPIRWHVDGQRMDAGQAKLGSHDERVVHRRHIQRMGSGSTHRR